MCIALHIPRPSHSQIATDNYPDISHLSGFRQLAPRVQFLECLRAQRRRPECHLTTLFGTDAVPAVSVIDASSAPKKHGWLPLLTVLFLISYGLMTMLIVEQGQTIESQRALIRELFRDSTELSAVKMKAAQDNAQSSPAKTQAPVAQNPSSQNPSSQTPDPVPVNPGFNHSGPVFPGRTATSRTEPVSQAETRFQDAVEAGAGSGRRRPDPDHHIRIVIQRSQLGDTT